MTDTASQNVMILAALKARGKQGMTSLEMQRAPIRSLRGAARVRDLRVDGHPIQTIMESNGEKRWARYVYIGRKAA